MASIQSLAEGRKVVVDSHTISSETQPLLGSAGKDPAGPQELCVEDKRQGRKRWVSIYVMYFTMFLSAVTFSIVLSSIWPFLLEVDYDGANTKFLGSMVAAYSIGQLVASPLLGVWADRRPTREPLLVATAINVLFSLLYSYAGAFPPTAARWVLLVSRALVGFGAGIAAVVRSYVSEATTSVERTGAMAGLGASQALGFILGPALGLAFVPLGSQGARIKAIRFTLNMYTGPGYMSALLGVLNLVLLVVLFRQRKITSAQRIRGGGRVSTDATPSVPMATKHYDRVAALVAILMFFVIFFVFSVFETVATPFSMDEFAWNKKQSVLYNNAFFAGLSVVSILTFIVVKVLTKRVDERVLWMCAMFLMAFGFFILIPTTEERLPVTISGLTDALQSNGSVNSSSLLPANQTLEPVGCRYPPQNWCTSLHRVSLAQYALSLLLLAMGFPTASLLCYSTYSKILGPFPQGTMMGVLTAAGSLARSAGPLLMTLLYHHSGPVVTFAVVVAVLAVSILLLLLSSPRLVPYR